MDSTKPIIEIFHFEMPNPQVSLDGKLCGSRGEVKVRFADDHATWEFAPTIREALRMILRRAKADGKPYFIDDYRVELTDTMRCQAFYADGREIVSCRVAGTTGDEMNDDTRRLDWLLAHLGADCDIARDGVTHWITWFSNSAWWTVRGESFRECIDNAIAEKAERV